MSVQVIHEHKGKRVERVASGVGKGMFLLTNKKGNFCSLCPGENISAYNGLVNYDATNECFVKSVENLVIPSPVERVTNRISSLERAYENGAVETFRMSSKALLYEVRGYTGEIFLDLDTKKLGDERTEGRHYRVHHEADTLIVDYELEGADGYQQVLILRGIDRFRSIGTWEERHYAYDARRGEHGSRWVYRAGAIQAKGKLSIIITRSATLEKALWKAAYVEAHRSKIIKSSETYVKNAFKEERLEENLALAALDALITKLKNGPSGILAGLPWFTQYWSRDELISLGALIKSGQYGLVKEILVRYYEILETPVLSAHYPRGGLPSADALGWLGTRTLQFLRILEQKKLLNQYFTKLELGYLRERMASAVRRLEAKRSAHGLVTNAAGETWMDTTTDGDQRDGVRIEIQALHLACYSLLGFLEEKRRRFVPLPSISWKLKHQEYLKRVKSILFSEDRLLDGMTSKGPDGTFRPNIFIAYYVAPDLLSKDEWRRVFDTALPHLRLDWGGLATIDKEDSRFIAHYSGANDASYHRGDSWYWINTLAALCLKRFDSARYKETIAVLEQSALEDMFCQGAIGHCSELSSAASQEWGGTFAQAWSAAFLYELLLG